MRGGRKSASDEGIHVAHRETLYRRASMMPEGTLFTSEDISQTPDEADDFVRLRNYDYIHVTGGYFTRIVETPDLRRLPKVENVLASYEQIHGVSLTPTGDRTAWRIGIKQWEPIKGYRYYTSGNSDLLSLGHMKIQLIAAPSWLRIRQKDAEFFRCFYDQPLKDLQHSLLTSLHTSELGKNALRSAAQFGYSIRMSDVPADWQCPHETSSVIEKFLATYLNEQKAA
jgi:hypothetical protein